MKTEIDCLYSKTPSASQEVPTGIHIALSSLRSVNIERDIDATDIGLLHISGRVQDILARVANALESMSRTRAWSMTGPYGSGKSTVALLVASVLNEASSHRHLAEEMVRTANQDLAERLLRARDRIAPNGFVIAAATARREPIAITLARALVLGVERRWSGRTPQNVARTVRALKSEQVTSAEVITAIKSICSEEPLLLIIDEFGKTLEYLAGGGENAGAQDDIYLLQEVAELGAGRSGLPLFTITLQHLSFLDYAATSTALQRREWAKIQGRFEDITFTPDLNDSIQLIREAIDLGRVSSSDAKLIGRHGDNSARMWSQLGLDGLVPSEPEIFETLYPVHPLAAVAAPLIAAQIGQNDRSLTGFLLGDEPFTVDRFVQEHSVDNATKTATVRVAQLYDYYFASGRNTILASAAASRWIEIDLIIGQAHGLDGPDLEILKTIGILNLVDAGGMLRASEAMLLFALTDPGDGYSDTARQALSGRLSALVNRGFLVYRGFSDEFRIWRGTDVDLQARIAGIRESCDDDAVAKMLADSLPGAVVAGRHSQRSGFLRHFVTATTGSTTGTMKGPDVRDPADGLLVFHFGDLEDLPPVDSQLPVVVGVSKDARRVLEAGRELMAMNELLAAEDLDAVARREVIERAGQIRAELITAMTAAFNPSSPKARWLLLPGPRVAGVPFGQQLEARSLAGIVSVACDIIYGHTPQIRNEMLGRHQLTSQGAKARRELITAIVNRRSVERLGISGYGPERAMYEGVLSYLGLHRPTGAILVGQDEPEYDLTEPDRGTSVFPAWEALKRRLVEAIEERSVMELFELLMAPPFGIKAGVVPVVVTTALILFGHDVALFEEGTYQPNLTPDLIERLIKAPDRYSIKYVPVGSGLRREALSKLADRLGLYTAVRRVGSGRNSVLLAVTRNLLNEIRGLSAYAVKTKQVSRDAILVREALISARDPDALLFTTLPRALGMEPILVGADEDQEKATAYADELLRVLDELRSADGKLQQEVVSILAREFRVSPNVGALREGLRARVASLADSVREPEVRGFVSLALNGALSDDEWLEPVVVRLARVGLPNWNDEQIKVFEAAARRLSASIDRLAALHMPRRADSEVDGPLQLLTLTKPDGQEDSILLYMPDDVREAAVRFATNVSKLAEDELGTDGSRILLASLARLIVSSSAVSVPEGRRPSDPTTGLEEEA